MTPAGFPCFRAGGRFLRKCGFGAERSSRGSELKGAVCLVLLCFLRGPIGGEAGEELVDEPGGILGIARYAEVPSSRGHVSQRPGEDQDPLVEGRHL